MATLAGFYRFIRCKKLVDNTNYKFNCINNQFRTFADTPKTDKNSKQVAVQGTEKEERLRVRRARASDVPRVLGFVREHARTAWPGLLTPPSVSNVVMCDYASRALAQGHSMLAEQQETRRGGWSQIRGLAIGASLCPWDARLLETWARCVKCTKSKRLMYFTAHCLRAPALHDKYRVHNILQVTLMVPQNTPRSNEVVQILTKNAIQRGRDVGFPLIRFDVIDANVAKSMEEMQLKKEWQMSYDILTEAVKETDTDKNSHTVEKALQSTATDSKETKSNKLKSPGNSNFITVYTAFTQTEKKRE